MPGEPAVARTSSAISIRRGTRGTVTGLGLSVCVIVFLIFAPLFAGSGFVYDVTQLSILIVMAVSWNLLAGYGGMISIGQQGYIGLGSFAVLGLSLNGVLAWYAVPIAIVIVGVISLPVSYLAFRLRGGYFAIGTWVIASVFEILISQNKSLGAGSGLVLTDLNNVSPVLRNQVVYWFALGIGVITLVTTAFLLRSRVGLALMAVRDGEIAARATGVNIVRTKRIVYVLAAAMGAGAGALLILSNLEAQPAASFNVQYTAYMIFMVVVGGMGTFEGPIIGAILFFVLQQSLDSYGAWYLVLLGATAVAAAIWLPRGIWGLVDPEHHRSLVPLRHRVSMKDGRVGEADTSAGR